VRFLPILLSRQRAQGFFLVVLLISFGSVPTLRAQVADTAAVAVTDTAQRVTGLDTLVVYKAADSISYSLRTRYMNLHGSGELQYRTIKLTADRVAINWDTATLTAEGVEDTTGTFSGLPILNDAGEVYDGFRISYNFRSKKGKIDRGETELEGGFYHGSSIKKVAKDVLFVSSGRYTTCDLDHPHFYFMSPKMKVIPGDVIVAEPVFLYIADVPVFALPFGVFPNRSGRRSGIIAPAYGEDARLGRYFSHFGYYWAISEYLDLASAFDWYSQGGWGNSTLFRYKLRYEFDGSVAASVNRRHQGEEGDPDRTEQRDYNIRVVHNQNIDPTTNLGVNFSFMSGGFYRNFSQNLEDALRQNVVSNATLTKSWVESNRSLSVTVLRDQNLISGNIVETLPSVSFNQGTVFPFKGLGAKGHWAETIALSYRGSGTRQRQKIATQVDSVFRNNELQTVTEFERTTTQSLDQSIQLSVAPRLGHFTISPSLRFSDTRTFTDRRTPVLNRADSSVAYETSRPTRSRGSLAAGLSTSTRVYGILQPNILGVTALRHTLNPTVSFNYAKQVYGTSLGPSSLTAALNVQNLFEMKYQPSDTAKEEKIQLMNVGANLNYDFRAKEFPLSVLTVTYRTAIGRLFDFSASTIYNFYVFDRQAGRRINKLLIDEKGYLADLTNFTFSLGTSVSGKRAGGSSTTAEQQTPGERAPVDLMQGFYQTGDPDFSIPWDLRLNLTFSQSQADPRNKIRSASLQAQLSFNLTSQWKIEASGNYDLIRKQIAAPNIRISRDLHCWIMNFNWIPIGPYRSYRLEIRVKAPQLADLKLTKQGSDRGVYY